MSKNITLPIYFILLLFIWGCKNEPKHQTEENAPSRTNIVFIMADDLGYGELVSYGQNKIETPNIDALANNGMLFTQAYSGSPVCAPSRCVLLTGMHTGNAFLRSNDEMGHRGDVWSFEDMYNDSSLEGQIPMPTSVTTVAEKLKEAGYNTGAIGKWGLGGPDSVGHPNNQGFDYFYGYLCQRIAHTYYPTHLWRNEDMMAFWDIMPTLCDVAGISPNNSLDGISMLPSLLEKEQKQDDFLYWEFPSHKEAASSTNGEMERT